MRKSKIRTSTMIYHDFLESNLLTGQEKLVFILLKRFADSDNKSSISVNELSKLSSFSKSTIQKILKSLQDKKVLSIEHRKTTERGNISNLYTLYDTAETWQRKK